MLVDVRHLVKHYFKRGGVLNRPIATVHAVNSVCFTIERGEIVGVVGESGCGKSTLGRLILRLVNATSGRIYFDGHDISDLNHRQMLAFRRRMQIVFQDPQSSLNPRMTVDAMLREAVRHHRVVEPKQTNRYVDELIEKVGLRNDDKRKYPHEFSGGQKQRIGIARALAVQPEFIVADEPISALDVSIQAQVLNLMADLKYELGLTILFISHDLRVVDFFCDRMLVMYLGHIVEELPCHDSVTLPRHPYTQSLMAANPIADPNQRQVLSVLEGEVPNPYEPPAGCPFVTRCPLREDRCDHEMPPLLDLENSSQRVACWAVNPP